MSLARNARSLAGARPGDETAREVMFVAGALIVVVGWAVHPVGLMVGGILLGYAMRPSAERYYLEGFANGIVAADVDAAAPAADRGRPDRDVGSLPAVAGEPAGYADAAGRDAPRAPSHRFAPTRGVIKERDLADALGVHAGDGPPRPPLDDAGRPTTLRGPSRPSAVPPAVTSGPAVRVPESVGASPDQQADRGKRKGAGPSLREVMK